MTYYIRIKAAMENAVATHNLPQYFKEDLQLDFEGLERYNGHKLVWLLRTSGTVMVPTGIGVDPTYITHWLWSNHSQEIVPFVIDTRNGTVEKVTYEQAEKLISEPPCKLTFCMPREELIEKVNGVLEYGCQQRIWGMFDAPKAVSDIGGWLEWERYFSNSSNSMMTMFMAKALRCAHHHQKQAA